MFDILFGWRKASKCKKLIKRVLSRLKLLKSKRHSIVRQLRQDVAQLIKIGYQDIAFTRAEHLFKDETLIAIYELLENFCEFIIVHLSYIRRHKDCPNDINEAVSTLIFASARCGDLPELRAIRKLFGERYGHRFEMTALELFPGNLVNFQVKEKLCINSVPDDAKQKLVDEIARDYCLQPETLATEYTLELQKQAKAHGGIQASEADVASTAMSSAIPSDIHQDNMISTSISSSVVEQFSPDVMESPMHSKANAESQKTRGGYVPSTDCQDKRKTTSSSECLPQFPEEMIVYLDDVEEIQQSITQEGSCQDQRIFKFKTSVLPKNGKAEEICDVKYMDEHESWNDCSSSSSSRKRVKTARKRIRRRSASRENSVVKDIECVVYYEKLYKRSSNPLSHLHCKHHMKNLVQNSEQTSHTDTRQKQPHSCCCFNFEAEDCCLNHTCYLCSGDGRNDQGAPHPKQTERIIRCQDQKPAHIHFHHCQCSRIAESDREMEWYTFPHRPRRRSCGYGVHEYDPFINSDYQADKQSKVTKENVDEFDFPGSHLASNSPSPMVSSPLTRKATKPPYLRAMTMPQDRSRGNQTDNVLRSKSFPIQSPNHVHPKLPDYDEIAAKFMALKKEKLQNRHN